MITLSIVEDNVEIRENLCHLIGLSPELEISNTFSSAEEALDGYTPPQVFLVDIHLGKGISGIEFIKHAKPIHPETQFLVLSSMEDDDSIFSALQNGATGYLSKTSSVNTIINAITEIYHGGSPMSPQIARRVISNFQSRQPTQNNGLKENIHNISKRESEILNLLSEGFRYKEIGDKLFISTETVRTHIRNIYEKLQVNCKMDALKKLKMI